MKKRLNKSRYPASSLNIESTTYKEMSSGITDLSAQMAQDFTEAS